MKGKQGDNWWLSTMLTLPIMVMVLLRVLYFSIQVQKQELSLFFELYLLLVPLELLIRIFLFGQKGRGWRHWVTWICRWAGIVMLVLSILFLLDGGSWDTLFLPYLYRSRNWLTMAMIPLRPLFVLSGMTVILSRKATRGRSIKYAFIIMLPLFVLFGVVGSLPAVKASILLSDFMANGFLLGIPYLYGLAGALVDPLFGKKLRLNEERPNKKCAPRTAASPVPSVRRPAPAAPAAPPKPAAIRPPAARVQPRTAAAKPAPTPRPVEEELAEMKAAYETRMQKAAAAKQQKPQSAPPEEMLRRTAERLFSEGEAASTLGGQRQLIYWMAQAVPRLGGLIRQPIGKQFYAPSLPDDPDAFLPLLDALLKEAARLLENPNKTAEEKEWETREPETLCAGWYALGRFAAVSSSGQRFSDAAARLEKFIKKSRPCSAWLKNTFEGMKEGSGL